MVKPQIDSDMRLRITSFAGHIDTSYGFLGLKEVKAEAPDIMESVRTKFQQAKVFVPMRGTVSPSPI